MAKPARYLKNGVKILKDALLLHRANIRKSSYINFVCFCLFRFSIACRLGNVTFRSSAFIGLLLAVWQFGLSESFYQARSAWFI